MSIPTYTELTKSFGDQVVDAVKQAEERTVSLLSSATDAVSNLLPSSVPSLARPEGVPSATDVVSANALLVERVLAAQTSFVLNVLDTLSIPGEDEAAPKKTTRVKAS